MNNSSSSYCETSKSKSKASNKVTITVEHSFIIYKFQNKSTINSSDKNSQQEQ